VLFQAVREGRSYLVDRDEEAVLRDLMLAVSDILLHLIDADDSTVVLRMRPLQHDSL